MIDIPMHPLTSDRPLIVYLDFKSPYAYLAWEPTRAMARELGVAVDWRPFVLDIPSFLGSARLDGSGRVAEQSRSAEQWSGVKYSYFDCRRYANLRGLTVRGTVKIWDTNLAAVGMLWARQQGDEILERYVDAVYAPFWKRELDVEDPQIIREVLARAGADLSGFDEFVTGPSAAANAALQRAAFDAGIFGVPSYVVGGEIYFGREHLPRVRWHLTGERGPAPDVAYEVPGDVDVEPAHSMEVCVSFGDPQSFLAVASTLALARRLNRSVRWRPKLGRPAEATPAPGGIEDRGARHRRLRAALSRRDLERYAPVTMARVEPAEARAATAGLLWVNEEAPQVADAFVEGLFQRIWHGGSGPDDPTTVLAVLGELGLDGGAFAEHLRGEAADQALARSEEELRDLGVTSTPTFLLDGEPFVGRQHLPLIEARLRAAGPAG